uniref:Uncharacterized protein n=1 Tax=Anguilla anguilla TaxID=7936 RepID=A0A0E9PVD5_ANGAN
MWENLAVRTQLTGQNRNKGHLTSENRAKPFPTPDFPQRPSPTITLNCYY